jgi:hypothetical protein
MQQTAEKCSSAVSAVNDLCLEAIIEFADLAASYARSVSEAAWRADYDTSRVHLAQLRLTVIAALQTLKEIAPIEGEKAEAA